MNKFKILDGINNGIFYIYNILSEFVFHTRDRKYINITKKNMSLKGIHNGHCFIIGNGPSINSVDLNLIGNHDTFTVNFFYKSEKYTNYRSKYHLMIDDAYYENGGLEYFKSLYKEKRELVFFLRHHAFIKNRDIIEEGRIYYMYQKKMQVGKKINYDISKNCDACINVIISAIEIAIFLGYKKIYLLGCDFNSYCSLNENHFYQDDMVKEIKIADELRYYALAHKHLYALEEYAKNNGIHIVNLTETSLIDAFEKSNLDTVLNEHNLTISNNRSRDKR